MSDNGLASGLAAVRLLAFFTGFLNRRARQGSESAKHAAVPAFWPEKHAAPLAVVIELTRIGRHGFGFPMLTERTGDGGLEFDHANRRFQRA
jgi:hypothetical protein